MIRVILVILIIMGVDQLSFNNSNRDPLYNHIMQGIGADCQRTNPQVVIYWFLRITHYNLMIIHAFHVFVTQ